MDSKSGKLWLFGLETAPPETTGYLGWKQMQKRSQAEANGDKFVRSRKAKGKLRLHCRQRLVARLSHFGAIQSRTIDLRKEGDSV